AGASEWTQDVPQCVMQHETGYACTGVKNRQDEQRLKHDGEVVPDSGQRIAAQATRENVRHAHGKCRSAAGTVVERLLSNRLREPGPRSWRQGGAPTLHVPDH